MNGLSNMNDEDNQQDDDENANHESNNIQLINLDGFNPNNLN